jgi:hypothetical protein
MNTGASMPWAVGFGLKPKRAQYCVLSQLFSSAWMFMYIGPVGVFTRCAGVAWVPRSLSASRRSSRTVYGHIYVICESSACAGSNEEQEQAKEI